MAAKEPTEILTATESFVSPLGTFRGGDKVSADHPAVKKYPKFFTARDTPRIVEQATAAPGEKRQR